MKREKLNLPKKGRETEGVLDKEGGVGPKHRGAVSSEGRLPFSLRQEERNMDKQKCRSN